MHFSKDELADALTLCLQGALLPPALGGSSRLGAGWQSHHLEPSRRTAPLMSQEHLRDTGGITLEISPTSGRGIVACKVVSRGFPSSLWTQL